MRLLCIIVLVTVTGGTAMAHPHPGGIVVRPTGTVIVGDILGSRLLVIEPSGNWREICDVGHVRELEQAANGTIYGVSQSQGLGLWTLGRDERPVAVLPNFHGLFTFSEDGSLALAAADPHDRRPRLDIRSSDGRHSMLATLEQIEALAFDDQVLVVADGAAIRVVERDGKMKTLAEQVGVGLYGLTIGPEGPIVAVYGERTVVEIARDGTRRVLLTSEPPWAPTDVTFHDGALYVVELAQHPCCWKGPRVRRLVAGAAPATLFTIDDGDHLHLAPWEQPLQWMVGVGILAAVLSFWVILTIHRRTRRRLSRRSGAGLTTG